MNQALSLELLKKYANKVPSPTATPPEISPLPIAQPVPTPIGYTPQSRSSLPVMVGILLIVGTVIVYYKVKEYQQEKLEQERKSL